MWNNLLDKLSLNQIFALQHEKKIKNILKKSNKKQIKTENHRPSQIPDVDLSKMPWNDLKPLKYLPADREDSGNTILLISFA